LEGGRFGGIGLDFEKHAHGLNQEFVRGIACRCDRRRTIDQRFD